MHLPTEAIRFIQKQNVPTHSILNPNLEFTFRPKASQDRSKPKAWGFVIPKNGSKSPENNADVSNFGMDNVELIGVNGWNWVDCKSDFVAYDIDSIVGHRDGLDQSALNDAVELLKRLPYVQVQHSKSGRGFHLIVHFDATDRPDAPNRLVHYENRRRMFAKMCVDAQTDLKLITDKHHTGIIFIYSASRNENSFQVIQCPSARVPASELPPLPEKEKKQAKRKRAVPTVCDEFDLDAWFAKHGLTVSEENEPDGSTRYRINPKCPFNDDGNGQWAIWRRANGKIHAECFHAKCKGKGWAHLWKHFEGDNPVPGTIEEAIDDPARLARLFRAQAAAREGADCDVVCWWKDTPYLYRNGQWNENENDDLLCLVRANADAELGRQAMRLGEVKRKTNNELVYNVVAHVKTHTPRTSREAPFLFSVPNLQAKYLVGFRNGFVEMNEYAKALAGEEHASFQMEPSPDFFTTGYADYDFDPNAPEPTTFLRTLKECVPCEQARRGLQEIAGYGLIWDTSLQIVQILQGIGGSGKSLYTDVMKDLYGANLVKPLDLHSLQSTFWGESLIGRRHVHITEAKNAPRDADQVASVLKRISGEDDMDLDRKNKTHWSGRLQVLCTMIMNGELDYLKDPSEAMLSRLWYFQFPNKFRGQTNENTMLRQEIKPELPGVLNWAAEGLSRLIHVNKWKITPNPGSERLRLQFKQVNAPVSAWGDEEVASFVGDKSRFARIDDLKARFNVWRDAHGVKELSDRTFHSEFRLKFPHAEYKQSGRGGPYVYAGVELRN